MITELPPSRQLPNSEERQDAAAAPQARVKSQGMFYISAKLGHLSWDLRPPPQSPRVKEGQIGNDEQKWQLFGKRVEILKQNFTDSNI